MEHKHEKDRATPTLLAAYLAYLEVFQSEAQVYIWAASVAQELKRHKLAAENYRRAAEVSKAQVTAKAGGKKSQPLLNTALAGEIVAAESSNQSALKIGAYNYYLATATDDRTIRVWNLDKDYSYFSLVGHQDSVWSVDFSPNGR